MADKARKVSALLQTLSRVPGLGFLAQTEDQLRDAIDQYEGVGDQIDDTERHLRDVKTAAADVASSDDEEL